MALWKTVGAVLCCFTAVLADTNAATTWCLNLGVVQSRDTGQGKSRGHHSTVRTVFGSAACQAVLWLRTGLSARRTTCDQSQDVHQAHRQSEQEHAGDPLCWSEVDQRILAYV